MKVYFFWLLAAPLISFLLLLLLSKCNIDFGPLRYVAESQIQGNTDEISTEQDEGQTEKQNSRKSLVLVLGSWS